MTVAELHVLVGGASLLNYGNDNPKGERSRYRYKGYFVYAVSPWEGHPGEYLLTMGTGMYQDDWVTPAQAADTIEVDK